MASSARHPKESNSTPPPSVLAAQRSNAATSKEEGNATAIDNAEKQSRNAAIRTRPSPIALLGFRVDPDHPHMQKGPAPFVAPTLALRYYRKLYSPSAFFSADTRRRLTGIFSSTPLSVSSSVPPATGSISSTMDRFTR